MHDLVLLVFYSDFWAWSASRSGGGGIFFDLDIFWGNLRHFLLRGASGVAI